MSTKVTTALNPFVLLDVSVRDNSRTILQAVEDQSLMHDQDVCHAAGALLMHPRRRIEAELGWFPGLNPNAAKAAAAVRSKDDIDSLGITGLHRANAFVQLAQDEASCETVESLKEIVAEIIKSSTQVDLGRIVQEINEDRQLAGFPIVSNVEMAATELERRRELWRHIILDTLNRAQTDVMAEAIYDLVKEAISNGYASALLHEVVDDYGLRVRGFMDREIAGAQRLVSRAKELAGSRPDALPPILDAIDEMLETWEQLTFPMHASLAHRGQSYDESEELAKLLRDLAIELHNTHKLTQQAQQLSSSLHKAFEASPVINRRVTEDLEALDSFQAQSKEQLDDLYYTTKVGFLGLNLLSISPEQLQWRGEIYPVASIVSARWGAIRKSVNGVPSGTDYLIAWSDGRTEAVANFGSGTVFEAFISRLVQLLAEPLVTQMLSALKLGRELWFGEASVRDYGVTLKKSKFFGSTDIEYGWNDVTIESLNGNLVIRGNDDPKIQVAIPYRETPNVHFLEIVIRATFKKGSGRLSDAF
ncbi:hypothetical protein M3P36_04950 [Altererythrobacter sp. KTW20L]|uniref:hypothetical protein n=1 Tax=Altererythrobacter sp. KTW20L TaxID=2942210 RepID=UPI0020BE15FA|nr:hypothetical protein [Altererythrobacter sp. KTW20L]MCL6250397.1 hypothetical protein [Altererythrobacter sp. KTW20L]